MTPCLLWATSWRGWVPRWIVMGDLVLLAGIVANVALTMRTSVDPLLNGFTYYVGVALHFLSGGRA